MHIDLIGVPLDIGAGRRGVDMGPSAIRYADLQLAVSALGKAHPGHAVMRPASSPSRG